MITSIARKTVIKTVERSDCDLLCLSLHVFLTNFSMFGDMAEELTGESFMKRLDISNYVQHLIDFHFSHDDVRYQFELPHHAFLVHPHLVFNTGNFPVDFVDFRYQGHFIFFHEKSRMIYQREIRVVSFVTARKENLITISFNNKIIV